MSLLKRLNDILQKADLGKIITAVFSQGILSLANFITGIVMVKYASKTEYGLYVILFSLVGLLGGYQSGIIHAPLIALVNKKNDTEKRAYIKSLGVGRNYIFLPPLLIISLVVVLYGFMNQFPGSYLKEGFIIFIVGTTFLSKEYFRVLNYIEMDIKSIFRIDMINVFAVFIGLFVVVRYFEINSFTALIVIAIGYSLSYFVAKRKRVYEAYIDSNSIKHALLENWNYGKWMVLGVTSSLLQERGYIFIASGALGLGPLAEISAARLFMMPIGLISVSITTIAFAKGSKMSAEHRDQEFRKFIFLTILALCAIWLIYVFFLWATSDFIIGFLGEKYMNAKHLIVFWSLYFFVNIIRVLLGIYIMVYRQFKLQSIYDIAGSTMSIVSCLLMIHVLGKPGAIVSLIIGEFITMILYVNFYRRHDHFCLQT